MKKNAQYIHHRSLLKRIGLLMLCFSLCNTGQIFAQTATVKLCYKSQAGGCPAHNYSIGTNPCSVANFRESVDDKLLNPANFGPSGTSKITFNLYDFGSTAITYSALVAQGCQIFDVGLGITSDTEKTALSDWTSAPGHVLLAFQDYAAYFGSPTYVATGSGNNNPNSYTPIGLKIFDSVFGTTNTFNQGGTYQGTFSSIPVNACKIIQDASGDATGVLDNTTGDVFLADVDLVSALGGVSTGAAINNNSDIFLANLYNGLAKIALNAPNDVCSFFSCSAGTDAPVLNGTSLANNCTTSSTVSVNLNSLFTGTVPANTTLSWHTATPVSDANRIANPAAYAGTGTVYAAFRANDGSCYSPGSTGVAVTVTNCSAGTIDCSKTQIYTAPVAGSPGQKNLIVTLNVTTAGCFMPLTVSGSGMTVANNIMQVCTSITGVQELTIPVNYDGSPLGTLNFTVGSAGSCSADLTKIPKKGIVDLWTLDCVPTVGPALK